MQAGRAIEPQKFIAAFLDHLKQIAPSKRPQPMDMRIPAHRLALQPA